MYRLMVAINPTRATTVYGGHNEGLNFGNVVADSETVGDRNHGGSGGIGRKLEFCHCGGGHLKKNFPKRAEEKEKKKNYDGGANDKSAEVKGRQMHTMFMSSVDVQSGIDFSELGEDDEFTWC